MTDRISGRSTVDRMSDVIPTQSASRDIPWEAGRWTNRPVSTKVSKDGTLHVTAAEGSDAWRHTSYGFVHDTEHALLVSFTPRTSMEVEFGTPFEEQFDRAGVFVRVSAEHWVKAGIEFTDGTPHIGAVVTDGRSDWSATPVQSWSGQPVTMRISWTGDALTVRARCSDGPWELFASRPLMHGKASRQGHSCARRLAAGSRSPSDVGASARRTVRCTERKSQGSVERRQRDVGVVVNEVWSMARRRDWWVRLIVGG